jgi:hypothetical protein
LSVTAKYIYRAAFTWVSAASSFKAQASLKYLLPKSNRLHFQGPNK